MKKLFLIDPNQRKIPTDSGKWLNVNYGVGFRDHEEKENLSRLFKNN